MAIRVALLFVIGVMATAFAVAWLRDIMRRRSRESGEPVLPTAPQFVIGFVTNFFDTLGIGSFATTTAAFKTLRLVPDEEIPGTMIIGHDLPVVVQAFIFIAAVSVDPMLMLTLIAATVAGGWLGAGVVTRLPRAPIQVGMGVGLLLAATFMAIFFVPWFFRLIFERRISEPRSKDELHAEIDHAHALHERPRVATPGHPPHPGHPPQPVHEGQP